MKGTIHRNGRNRRGAAVVIVAVLLIPLLAVTALAIDYGYLLKQRTDLQRINDAAALAGALELVPATDGSQDHAAVRQKVKGFVAMHYGAGFTVNDADIEIGKYDPNTIYDSVDLLYDDPTTGADGFADTVRVKLKRNDGLNGPVGLFFANVLGIGEAPIATIATAVMQRGMALPEGAPILPFAVPYEEFDDAADGDIWNIYGDGKILDGSGTELGGNWGTVDIGAVNNSTAELKDQIENGLRQQDIDELHADGRTSSDQYIGGQEEFWANGDTGLSAGMDKVLQSKIGTVALIPLYDTLNDVGGGGLEAHIVGWAAVELIDAKLGGAKKSYVEIQKGTFYFSDLYPTQDLGDPTVIIEGTFTYPALAE